MRPADSGELALAAVAANPPDLILLDIRMPGLDGLRSAGDSRRGAESRDIPIIFISASGEVRSGWRACGWARWTTSPSRSKPRNCWPGSRPTWSCDALRVRLEQQSADLQQVNEQLQSELAERTRAEQTLRQTNAELAVALGNVKSLSGLLPICSACKGIRDDKGYWTRVETYISENSDATFTHGLCPDCLSKLYPGFGGGGPADSAQRAL